MNWITQNLWLIPRAAAAGGGIERAAETASARADQSGAMQHLQVITELLGA